MRFKQSILVLFGLLLAVFAAQAQISSSTGAVQGTVSDPQKASIANASVVMTNIDTAKTVEVHTQSDGTFVFPLVPPGNYKIEVQSPGFQTEVIQGVNVNITKVTTANAQLNIGQVSVQETVVGRMETVDTHTATTGDVISGTQIREIPLPTRNFLDLTA